MRLRGLGYNFLSHYIFLSLPEIVLILAKSADPD